jgi:hypothetical protein
MKKSLISALIIPAAITFSYVKPDPTYEYLERAITTSVGGQTQTAKKKQVQPSLLQTKRVQTFKYEIIGSMSLRDLLNLVASVRGDSLIIDPNVQAELDRQIYVSVRTNDFDTLLETIQNQADVWVMENPLSKTLEVKKYKWITVYPDLEGTTTFSLSTGAGNTGGGEGGGNNTGG